MSESLIDILMATYNGERFVGEQIESIQAQTYDNWRLLVSDDCSTDGTLSIVRRYADQDDRIRIVSEGVSHGGAKENFFALMAKSSAPYVMFCDQDDVWLSEKVEKCLEAMKTLEYRSAADTPLMVFCDMKVVDADLNVINNSFERSNVLGYDSLSFNRLLVQNTAAGCCILVNRETIKDSLLVSNYNSIEMHDWWLVLVASALGRVRFVDEPLSLYRQHDTNAVGSADYQPLKETRDLGPVKRGFLVTLRQAETFKFTYGSMLSSENFKTVERYVSISSERNFLKRLVLLVQSGCFKKGGTRIVGQFVMAATYHPLKFSN